MKKKLLLALLLIIGISGSAQNSKGLFLKLGLGCSDMIEDHTDINSKPEFSFKFGGGYEFQINKHFGIEPALMFTHKGARSISLFNSQIMENKENLNLYYLEIPLSAVFHVTPSLSLNVGPYFSYRFADKQGKLPQEYLESSDAGVQSELRYHIGSLFIGAEASAGVLGHLWRAESWNGNNQPGLRSLNYGFTIGYKL
jgi:hypothetical protein